MLIDFTELDNQAKVFLYPSSKKFFPELLDKISTQTTDFLNQWSTEHDITVGFEIKYQRFLIVAVNNDKPISTEIIDALVGFIFKLQLEYDLELMDKLNVCFKQGEYVQYKDVKEFKKLIKSRSVNENTIVFNNLINTKEELEDNWELPAIDTWYDRMF
ncbi:ABC transporter ATPase [Flavobacteriaceae bacterium]|nr:ABC transporter ATPase [Flavobacteriaceae bacterium]